MNNKKFDLRLDKALEGRFVDLTVFERRYNGGIGAGKHGLVVRRGPECESHRNLASANCSGG